MAITTGMRLGEIMALRWADIDLKGKAPAIHVRATLRYINSDVYYFDPPKTRKSRRNIRLTTAAADALRAHRARQAEERLAAGARWRDDELVFCTARGVAINGNHLSGRDFKALLRKADLPAIRFHDLRHTCATLLLLQGISPKVVSEMLGHSTVSMTLDRYSHVLPDMQEAATDADLKMLFRSLVSVNVHHCSSRLLSVLLSIARAPRWSCNYTRPEQSAGPTARTEVRTRRDEVTGAALWTNRKQFAW
ncbi:MAG TPA: site-specific integrase [Ktedonobacterales bacterium]|nr:site-specific integrase [Ktedonobacterales bacterium]